VANPDYLKDVYSYNKEQAINDSVWNAVELNMRLLEIDANAAVERVREEHKEMQKRLLCLLEDWESRVPSFGPEADKDLRTYIDRIVDFVRGNRDYSLECNRYFTKAEQDSLRETGSIPLRPKIDVTL
jgi:hypothetical protein